MQTINVERT